MLPSYVNFISISISTTMDRLQTFFFFFFPNPDITHALIGDHEILNMHFRPHNLIKLVRKFERICYIEFFFWSLQPNSPRFCQVLRAIQRNWTVGQRPIRFGNHRLKSSDWPAEFSGNTGQSNSSTEYSNKKRHPFLCKKVVF